MVKADLTRDYYGDLELPPGADALEIKKQFKKLALTYHPDRNPGRESEVVAKFQKIQSAHEVLSEPSEKAKYDANRIRTTYKASYSGGTASGVRGNPWSNAGSQWAPPPKAPTARNRAPPPPPSAGARRYDKFDAPKTSSSQYAYEGAEARKGTYEAWEHMKGHTAKPSQTRTAPKPPPREPPRPAKDYRKPPPKPAYEEYRDSTSDTSPHRRSASTSASARKGFMPNTPGGDEPAAPRGAYFTTRAPPPEVPPRNPPPVNSANVGADPLRQFRDIEGDDKVPNLEKRYTPYATHGGEKLNPFESANLNRSKSTREPSTKGKNVPRTGSDPNLASPRRPRSFAADSTRPRTSAAYQTPTVDIDSDSSDDVTGPHMNGHAFGKSRASMRRSNGAAAPRGQPDPNAAEASPNSRKPKSKLTQFQQWTKENPGKQPDVDSWIPDGPPLRSEQPSTQSDKDKMYASSDFPFFGKQRTSSHSAKLPTVSEKNSAKHPKVASRQTSFAFDFDKFPNLFPTGDGEHATPSGAASEPHTLNPFEGLQRNLVDQLLSHKSNSSSRQNSGDSSCAHDGSPVASRNGKHAINGNRCSPSNQWQNYRDPFETASPSKKSKPLDYLHSVHLQPTSKTRGFYSDTAGTNTNANHLHQPSRFTFPVDNDTFQRTQPTQNGFTSNSAENISTKFAAEDWAGTFEAGTNIFKLDPKAAGPQPRGRAQSASRSRGRSPIKVSTAPKFAAPAEETPIESPGGAKFSAEQWSQYFKPGKPGLFAPTPGAPRPATKKGRGSVARPTMGGKAAVVDDSETPDEKPLFDAKPAGPSTPFPPSPDAMDVDTPPNTNTVPQFAERPNTNKDNLKRPAGSSQPQSPTDTEGLKVNFDDMKIQDLISSLNLPSSPTAPAAPQIPSNYERPGRIAFSTFKTDFAKYMKEWDVFNNQFMLHLVARKNQVDALGARRWEDENGVEFYRRGLREDDVVLKHWQDAREVHEKAIKEFVVVSERIKTREDMAATPSPRKKTH
ncbi:Meiotically up-regulated protein [Lachnellula subtilissima]|uniref:Meiotically up-regulated protein n=1 Tax=Lachnellula subtilissima TaxID=602034 RepID=A0A8H8RM05_9HELO|nr:Meiotically up-regulated protein [Lachnellula subtilissima]